MSFVGSYVIPLGVASLSFVVSVDLSPRHLRLTLRQPGAVAIGLAAQLVVLPALVLAAAPWISGPALLAALLLVALAPTGPTSNFLSALARADLAYAVVLSVGGTLLSVAVMPLALGPLLSLAGVRAPELLPPWSTVLQGLLVMVVLPTAAGMWLGHRYPLFWQRWKSAAIRAATILFALLVAGALLAEWAAVRAMFERAAGWVVALNIASMACGWAVARLCGLSEPLARTLSLKCAIQSVSVAIALAAGVLGRMDIAAVAGMYGIVQLLTASAFTVICRYRTPSSTTGIGLKARV